MSELYVYLFKLLGDFGDVVFIFELSYLLFELLVYFEGLEMVCYFFEFVGLLGCW